jgi:hypothetical protein
MKHLLLIVVLAVLVLRGAVPSWAHAGSSTPVPRGCHIVIEKILVDGVEIALRRIACPTPKSPTTS